MEGPGGLRRCWSQTSAAGSVISCHLQRDVGHRQSTSVAGLVVYINHNDACKEGTGKHKISVYMGNEEVKKEVAVACGGAPLLKTSKTLIPLSY